MIRSIARWIYLIIAVAIVSSLFYVLFHFAGIEVESVLKFGQYLFTIATIFFPVLISMILGFNFPANARPDIVSAIKKDLHRMMYRSVVIFAITSSTLIPLLLFDSQIKEMSCIAKETFTSLIVGFLATSIIYYVRRFFQLFHLNNQLDDACLPKD